MDTEIKEPELAVLGGVFAVFDVKPLDVAFGREFLRNPFTCRFMGDINYYCSNILSDWINYTEENLKWITHVDTFLFWWKHTETKSIDTYILAVNFEQYAIADKCLDKKRKAENVEWYKTGSSEIKDVPKFIKYVKKLVDIDKCSFGDLCKSFNKSAVIHIVTKKPELWKSIGFTKIVIKNDLCELFEITGRKSGMIVFDKFNKRMLENCKKHKIFVHYKLEDIKNLNDIELELLLSCNPNIPFDGDFSMWYKLETIRRKITGDTTSPHLLRGAKSIDIYDNNERKRLYFHKSRNNKWYYSITEKDAELDSDVDSDVDSDLESDADV